MDENQSLARFLADHAERLWASMSPEQRAAFPTLYAVAHEDQMPTFTDLQAAMDHARSECLEDFKIFESGIDADGKHFLRVVYDSRNPEPPAA